jgi:hypothetical protein
VEEDEQLSVSVCPKMSDKALGREFIDEERRFISCPKPNLGHAGRRRALDESLEISRGRFKTTRDF